MNKIIFFLLGFIGPGIHAQVITGSYQTYKGNVMGAETVIHLNRVKDQATGTMYLLKDPRPFFFYGSEIKGDSIFLYGDRSMQTSMQIMATIKSGNIKGTAKLELEGKTIRSGAATLLLDTVNYTAFDFYTAAAGSSLPPAMKNQSRYEQSAATIWPKANDKTPVGTFVQKKGLGFLNQKTTAHPLQFLSTSQQQNIKKWKADNAKAYPKGAADMGLSLSATTEQRFLVLQENKTCINFIQYYFSESGGAAHGSASSELLVIDKRNNKQLKLPDILTPAGIKVLPLLLDKAARSQFGIAANAPLDQRLLVKRIEPSDQFFMADAGIGFWYNAYQVASFADGDVILFIPLALISKYIQPAFLK